MSQYNQFFPQLDQSSPMILEVGDMPLTGSGGAYANNTTWSSGIQFRVASIGAVRFKQSMYAYSGNPIAYAKIKVNGNDYGPVHQTTAKVDAQFHQDVYNLQLGDILQLQVRCHIDAVAVYAANAHLCVAKWGGAQIYLPDIV